MDTQQLVRLGIEARKSALLKELQELEDAEKTLTTGTFPNQVATLAAPVAAKRGRKAKGKRTISLETREKMAAAARKRWAAKNK